MPDSQQPQEKNINDLTLYAGRWVAFIGKEVVGQGGTPEHALLAAKASRIKESPKISYMPTSQPLVYSPPLEPILEALPSGVQIYLVGGAVRDAILERPIHDLDFVVRNDAIQIARCTADALNGAFYPLDEERNTGRVIFHQPIGLRMTIDFSNFQGPNLESDLRARDFTINAIAVDIQQPQALLDPLSGLVDLHAKQLRCCSVETFNIDPIRILRGIRFAAAFKYHILPETKILMQQATHHLPQVSVERLRDELFRILDGPQPAKSMRALNILGALTYTLPELPSLKGIEHPSPHVDDVWEHTLNVLENLQKVLNLLTSQREREVTHDPNLDIVNKRLESYQERIISHIGTRLNPDRSLRALILLSALYHDVGKLETCQTEDDDQIHFYGHEQQGSTIVGKRAKAMHLSNLERDRIKSIVCNHMRPLLLAQTGKKPSRRAVYRFFRDTGPGGVDICLLSLADCLATYDQNPPGQTWMNLVNVVHSLLEAWFIQPSKSVSPPSFISGRDLMEEFDLSPGPRIGQLLEAIREAQAAGLINSRQEALNTARHLINGI